MSALYRLDDELDTTDHIDDTYILVLLHTHCSSMLLHFMCLRMSITFASFTVIILFPYSNYRKTPHKRSNMVTLSFIIVRSRSQMLAYCYSSQGGLIVALCQDIRCVDCILQERYQCNINQYSKLHGSGR